MYSHVLYTEAATTPGSIDYVFLNILGLLSVILEIIMSSAVLSDSLGFLDPENMCIDIGIVLLGASLKL